MSNLTLRFKPLHTDVVPPRFGTSQSACFDLCAYAGKNADLIKCWTEESKGINLMPVTRLGGEGLFSKQYLLPPRARALVPTGIILDIPEGYSVRIHARSGLAIKGGLVMANSEGIVDSDYVNEVFVAVYNNSTQYITINHGDRIAQAEMVPVLKYDIEPTAEDITQKTERSGGFGSTGVS
jgi:dUTP pyrophosphatase